MAVYFNKSENKIVIEIACEAYGAVDEFRLRKAALLELLRIADEERLDINTRFWAMQMIEDFEPTEEQYESMFSTGNKKNSNKKEWVSVEPLPANFKKTN
ncbi:hypothetical protein ACFSKN_08185 [Mariniflexile gromovii]|uniref:Addiction module component n=1 Tax=Mariniflexile gromovii TaxID=362523 RepID=A0ABS4BUA8_9FLAO|nr:hypothetical protein [Mariniflexile gromovii]MBP0904170.1 hypothetical protein [Mariniflexile gromovii]